MTTDVHEVRRQMAEHSMAVSFFFGRSRPIFGLYPNLSAALVGSIALPWTADFGSTCLCEEAFSQVTN
jgi:hypothetical protein